MTDTLTAPDVLDPFAGESIEPDADDGLTPTRRRRTRKPRAPRAPAADRKPRAPRVGVSNAAIVKRAVSELEMLYGLAGAGLRFVDPVVGSVVVDTRHELAVSWTNLLETNKAVRDVFAESEKYGAWLPIIAAHAQLVAVIAVSHQQSRTVVDDSANDEPAAAPGFVPWAADGTGAGE